MFQREALEACELARREAPLARGVVVDASAAADGVANGSVAGVGCLVELGPELGAVVGEVGGDPSDGVVHGVEAGEVEARDVFGFAVSGFGEVGERLARAGDARSQRS